MLYSRLRGKIVEKFGTYEKFATHLGVSEMTISRKMNGFSEFSKNDMEQWGDALGIEPAEYHIYFFALKV